MTSLIIFDFDGTLFDTHESIAHSITRAFETFPSAPSSAQIQKFISAGTGLSDTFKALASSVGIDPSPENETQWTAQYREIYASEGQPLIKPFPGAKALLDDISRRKIPVAIVTNKGVPAVLTALERSGLAGYIPKDLIVGDRTPGATRKPDPSSYVNVLLPAVRAKYGILSSSPVKLLEIGDTTADIQFARNIGAKSCWCRFGYGDGKACEDLKPDYTVDSLEEVIAIIDSL